MTIARMYDFTDGEKVYSAQVDAELNQLVDAINAITGAAATDEAALTTHKSSADHDAHIATLHYTKTQMQTSGQAQLHWANLTNVPNLADASWKPSVAAPANLPITGNTVGDQRIVLNDGDGKQALYTCVATTGTYEEQWDKIGDVDWQADEANRVSAESARVVAEVLRVTAENGRDSAEDGRVSAESARVSAESARASAESGRESAEDGRVSAENAREAAIDARLVIGAYAAGAAYVVGNEVTYNGSTYRCILASTGNLPTNETYWILTAAHGNEVTITNNLTTETTGTALDAAQGKALDDKITALKRTAQVLQTASYTLALTDEHTIQKCYSASAIVVTIPTNAAVAFPTNSEIVILREGAGTVTITPDTGVTLHSDTEKRAIKARYAAATLKKIDTNEWRLFGALS